MAGADKEKRITKPTAKAAAAAEVPAPPEKRARGRPRKQQEPPVAPPTKQQGNKPVLRSTRATSRASTKNSKAQAAPPVDAPAQATATAEGTGKATKSNVGQKRKASKSVDGRKATKRVAIEDGRTTQEEYTLEPTDDVFVDTFTAGIVDGTIIEEDNYEEEDDLSSDDDILGAFSTPFPHKKRVVPKGRQSVGKLNIKVQVHDGVALRNVCISSKDGLYELLEKISNAMKRPSQLVEMGYEAPWSSKVGQKKNLAYVTNEDELDDFWVSLNRYAKGKYTSADEWGAGIVFRNMQDNLLQAAKANSRPKDAPGSKGGKPGDSANPRNSAQELVVHATEKIGVGMFCTGHNRLCYKTWDGKCRTYGPEFVGEHAKLLARGEPGVVADQVPSCMTSKLLDFVRPGRKNRAAIHSDALATSEAAGIGTINPPTFEAPPADTRRSVPPPSARDNTPPIFARDNPPGHKGPLDYPAIANWLRRCEEDLERGRDKHAYSSLAVIFSSNGCTRIDDIARMSREELRRLAQEDGLEATIGLINRVHDYATEDVAFVKKFGKLPS
ncbi:hypothetical protein SCHPADRAFT_885687 [Schizopora paradoxa]|uniref:Uncharacterized protein n=1 Tax=Schizopora paradoxa TaxID=27342 RepID=A0A0H2S526_9AGAM|nr:hypothetical protein SCHPADRAFT_885687 [Schizopora paradoxa]